MAALFDVKEPKFPSLTDIRALVAAERPRACPEFIDAVAMLAQCAFEDSEEANPKSPDAFIRPLTFSMVDLAAAYLNWSAAK